MRLCSIEGCCRRHEAHGWCPTHLRRWQKTGQLELKPRPTFAERFWAKVDQSAGPEGCWLWTGSIKPTGYGEVSVERRRKYAHRIAYELLVGPIPSGLQIDHLCRTKACVNPAHLEPVTNAENIRRWAATITHCPKGHPYDEANTVWYRGSRGCKTCRREWARRRAAA